MNRNLGVFMVVDINIRTHGLGALSVQGKISRLCVFKFGVLPSSTFYERFILNRWHNHFSGYGFCGYLGDFDILRAQSMKRVLLELGGEENQLVPCDKEASLEVIRLTSKALRAKIESLGGLWEIQDDRFIIKQPENRTPEWDSFYGNCLKRIFPKNLSSEGSSLVTSLNADKVILGQIPTTKVEGL